MDTAGFGSEVTGIVVFVAGWGTSVGRSRHCPVPVPHGELRVRGPYRSVRACSAPADPTPGPAPHHHTPLGDPKRLLAEQPFCNGVSNRYPPGQLLSASMSSARIWQAWSSTGRSGTSETPLAGQGRGSSVTCQRARGRRHHPI